MFRDCLNAARPMLFLLLFFCYKYRRETDTVCSSTLYINQSVQTSGGFGPHSRQDSRQHTHPNNKQKVRCRSVECAPPSTGTAKQCGHCQGFLSWFRNGLLATGIGVIAFVQSDVGREAGYAFFILGGVCVSFGGASYVASLLTLRRLMLLSVPAVLLHSAVVGSAALFWLCAVSLYIGRLEVEIIHEGEEEEEEDDDGEECRECRERREHRGYHRGSHDDRHGNKGSDNKGQSK